MGSSFWTGKWDGNGFYSEYMIPYGHGDGMASGHGDSNVSSLFQGSGAGLVYDSNGLASFTG